MLYQPERHERLSSTPWDEGLARDSIAEIVADAASRFDPVQFWPAHPREDGSGTLKGLWNGAAGAIWALGYLAECGAATSRFDCADAIGRVHAKLKAEDDPRFAGSFLMGELGVALTRWRITRERAVADRILDLIDSNAEQPTDELMWGAPGAALTASFVWEASGEERWREAFRRKADELWSRWKYRPEYDCHLWRQRLYQPEPRIFLGPVHGFSGNACAMMRAASMFSEQRREEIYDRIARVVQQTVRVEGEYANWLGVAHTPAPGQAWPWLVQWCHGAPGTIGALSAFPTDRDPRMESLFVAAGELTFAAGPLIKGPNLCHGTGGNGLLFLKLYGRTGDVKWLQRAHAFAMHGIEQYQHLRAEYGQGWYSLWTGDMGFAIYLWQCITTESAFPTMDLF